MRRAAVLASVIFLSAAIATASESGKPRHSKGAGPEARMGDWQLIEVMHDLAFHFSRVQFGIFTNNRHMIKEGAIDVVRHPMPEKGIEPFIKSKGEGAEPLIPQTIELIRKTAQELADAVDMATMLELQQKANVIAEVCVGCHDLYRD